MPLQAPPAGQLLPLVQQALFLFIPNVEIFSVLT